MKNTDSGKNIIFLLIILVILIASAIVVFSNMHSDPIESSISSDNIIKVLFVIEDGNKPVSANIIAYYPQTKRAAMFDIPQNTGLILKDLGRTDGIGVLYEEKGIDSFKKEIERLTGISVPFYITCTSEKFAYLTDMLGGLSIFIPTPVDLIAGEKRFLLPSGSVDLDGGKILDYLLYVDENDSDGEAASRKQKAVLALLRAINDNSAEIFKKDRFHILNSSFKSNLENEYLKKLLEEICKLDSERLAPQRVTGSIRIIDGNELLLPFRDGRQLKEIISQTLSVLASEDGAALERVYALEILNGTETQNLAKNTAEIYRSFGYDVVQIGNAENSGVKETVLIDRIGNPAVAKIVAQVIQCPKIQATQVPENGEHYGTEAGVDFTLVIGSDFNGYFVRPKKSDKK